MWDASTFPKEAKEVALYSFECYARTLFDSTWSLQTLYNSIHMLCWEVSRPGAAAQFSECIMSGLTASNGPHHLVHYVMRYFSRKVCLFCVFVLRIDCCT